VIKRLTFQFVLLILFACSAAGQVLSFPMQGADGRWMGAIQSTQMDFSLFVVDGQNQDQSLVQSPSASVSKLDLKAPRKARHEYAVGFRFLMRKDIPGAIDHLRTATSIYPSFVAAHNALGTAYLNLNRNEQARDEFSQAIALDDHLPNSYLNLGCAQLALKDYSAAEEALRKASSIAPLDLQLQLALAYGELQNHDYPAVIATEQRAHGRPSGI
jgi:Flp pilus assembly protein TadD